VFRQLAEGVAALHAAGKLHRDLKPSNVLVDARGRVIVLDFGLVANLTSDTAESSPLGDDESVPVRHQVYRSTDNTLTGTIGYMSPEQAARGELGPPSDWYSVGVMLFQALTGRLPFSGDAIHILSAKRKMDGIPPSGILAGIPEDLDRLAAALLLRDPAHRAGASDVLALLGDTLHAATVSGASLPEMFVGRTSHLDELNAAFDATREGRTVVCHVSGRSGAGKSTLISRFLERLPKGETIVFRGRCYEQESVPYKALDDLVDALAAHLMTLTPEDVDAMKPPYVADLVRVFPVLGRVGVLAAALVGPSQAHDLRDVRRHAFEALRALLLALGRRTPLVLYIDDLQWGDLDSAALLRRLLEPPDAPRLLLLLSYRSEYVGRSPCLQALTQNEDDRDGYLERRLDVDVLSPDDTRTLATKLLATTDATDAESNVDARAVEWVVRESGGRPFFVYELVEHLNSGAALGTQPDLDAVLWQRVERLPDTSRRLLEVIAVAGRPLQLRDAQMAALLPSLPANVVPALRASRLVRTTGPTLHDEIETFHDRIRESIVAKLPPSDKRHFHASLATTLERSGRADAETLAAHLEGAGDTERACRFYEQAASEAVQVLAFERAETLFARAAGLASNDADRARIHERMIHFYTDMARFADAYAIGRKAVEPFGIRLPAKFVPPLFIIDLIAARLRLRGRTTADLLALPAATDEKLLVAVRLTNAVAKAAYQVRPELCVAVTTKILNVCLRRGNTPDCAIAYMVFGAIFHGGVLGNYRFGYDFGRLALALVDRYRNDQQKAEVNFVVGYFGTSWLRPATEAEALWKTAYDAGIETGDLFHTGAACAATTMSYFMRGVPLDRLRTETERFLDFLKRNRLREPLGVVTVIRQAAKNLRGETRTATTLDDDHFDEAAFVREIASFGSRHFAQMYFILKTQLLYLRGEYDAALEMAAQSATYLKDSPGMLHSADHVFYQALAAAAAGRSRRTVARAASRFRKWASGCPDNFLPKSQLLDGEVARAGGRYQKAAALHAHAAESARKYGYLHIEALALDLQSRALMSAGQQQEAELTRAQASHAYARWGATSIAAASSAALAR
jgi:predicted ATPase